MRAFSSKDKGPSFSQPAMALFSQATEKLIGVVEPNLPTMQWSQRDSLSLSKKTNKNKNKKNSLV